MTSISPAVGVGLICALLSALGTNLAFLFKHRGAVAAPDVDMRHPLRSATDLFRSKWWSIGWGVAAVAFALHVAALTLAPISIGQIALRAARSSTDRDPVGCYCPARGRHRTPPPRAGHKGLPGGATGRVRAWLSGGNLR